MSTFQPWMLKTAGNAAWHAPGGISKRTARAQDGCLQALDLVFKGVPLLPQRFELCAYARRRRLHAAALGQVGGPDISI